MTPEIPDIAVQKEQFFERLSGAPAELQKFLAEVHPADLAEWLLDLGPEESWGVFEGLDGETRAEVLALAEDGVRSPLLEKMSLDLERAAGLRKLSRYDPESAGGVMTSELVTVSADLRIGDAIKLI